MIGDASKSSGSSPESEQERDSPSPNAVDTEGTGGWQQAPSTHKKGHKHKKKKNEEAASSSTLFEVPEVW